MEGEQLFSDVVSGLIPALILALLVVTARWILHVRDTVQEVNEAVNHRPKDEPKLYEMIDQRFTKVDAQMLQTQVQLGHLTGAFSEHRNNDQANFDRIANRLDRMTEPDSGGK